MAIVAVISQKGGVGKSILSQALVTEATRSGLCAKLADLDALQASSVEWHRVRLAQGVDPAVDVVAVSTISAALQGADDLDYLVLDCPGRSTANTLSVARAADLVAQPTGCSAADLRPAVRLFLELVAGGVPPERLLAVLCRVGTPGEERDARAYLEEADCSVVEGSLQERAAFRSCQNHGKAITEVSIRSLRVRAEALVQKIGERLS